MLIAAEEPVSVLVDTQGTGVIDEDILSKLVRDQFGLKPAEIVSGLNLLRPVYKETARNGHFGRSGPGFTWDWPPRMTATTSPSQCIRPSG